MKGLLLVVAAIIAAIIIRSRKAQGVPSVPATPMYAIPGNAQPVTTFPPSASPPPWTIGAPILIPSGLPIPGPVPVTTVGAPGQSAIPNTDGAYNPPQVNLPPNQTVTVAGISRPIYTIGIRRFLAL